MPSHRATGDTHLPDAGLAPLSAWEGRLRESSGWASSLAPLDPMQEAAAPAATWAPPATWAARSAAAGPAPAPARAATLLAEREPGRDALEAADPLDAAPRHSTGPVGLPWAPGVPAPRGELAPVSVAGAPAALPARSFAPVRGRRALPDPVTDPDLVLGGLLVPAPSAAPAPRRLDAEPPAERRSGRRRSHAAPDALPAPSLARERAAEVGPTTSAAPPQTRRGRRAATSARTPDLSGEDEGAAALVATPLAIPLAAPAAAFLATPAARVVPEVADDALVSTALLDLPPSLWEDEAPLAAGAPGAPGACEPVAPGEGERVFVPSRGRSIHRRPSRGLRVLPQAGLVGALGLATVIAPLASQHLPLVGTSGPTSLPHADASLVTSPVAAARALIAAATPASATSDVLSGRHRSTVSRSARRSDATDSGTSAASSSTAASSASAASSSTAAQAAQAASSSSASSAGSASSTASQSAAGASAASSNASVSASASASPSTPLAPAHVQSAEDAAVAALVPGCSGAVPDATGQVNGRLDADELCDLWQSGEALRSDAAVAFAKLDVAFKARFGTDLQLSASYRPYAEQVRLKRTRPAYAAVPGTSEHGWGLAVDLGGGVQNSDEHYAWLMENAPKYGWSHPAWAQHGGGGPYEPWHWEYAAGESSSDS